MRNFKKLAMTLVVAFLASPVIAQQAPEEMPPPGPPPLPHPDIPPPLPLPEHVSVWLVLGMLLVLGLLVAGIILLLFGRKASGSAPARRPIKEALQALKDLRNKADVLPPSEVGHGVSEIMRRFYEVRYSIPAPFRTSQELFPSVDLSQEPLRRRMWRERYEPLAAVYDALSYAPVPATTADATRLIDDAIHKLEEERLNEDARIS